MNPFRFWYYVCLGVFFSITIQMFSPENEANRELDTTASIQRLQ